MSVDCELIWGRRAGYRRRFMKNLMSSPFAFDLQDPMASSVQAMVRSNSAWATQPVLDVHLDDDMFKHSLELTSTTELGVMAYFRAGMQIQDAVRQIAVWHFGSLSAVGDVCDFASGYGRSTRFLAAEISPERVWAAEILPEAVDFQHSVLGVQSILSETDPVDLQIDRRFDLIYVSSLFSHLPDRTFAEWLDRLWGLLTDDGLLIMSVHDESLMRAEHGEMGASGHIFLPISEVAALDTDDYGATFVAEHYVADAIASVTGEPVTAPPGSGSIGYRRLARSLCFHQDLYLVPGRNGFSERELDFVKGPTGAVDESTFVGDDSVEFVGWSCSVDDPSEPVSVEVLLDGITLPVTILDQGIARPDVAIHLDDDRAANCGWRISVPLRRTQRLSDSVLMVRARAGDRRFVLHCAPAQSFVDVPPPPVRRAELFVAQRFDHLAHLLRNEGIAGVGRKASGVPRRIAKRIKH